MAALRDEAVAFMSIAEKSAGLAPAFSCPVIIYTIGASNYVCNLIALPTLAGWRGS